jgi:PAS domain S-box-containing protein
MKKKLFVLVIEDSQADAELNAGMLRKAGYDISFKRIETGQEMTDALEQTSWDLILSDYSMPLFSVQEALDIYHAHGADIPFIVISGAIGEEKAVELIKASVRDYVLKGNMARFILIVERALYDASEARNRIKLNKALAKSEEKYKSYIDNAPDGVFVVDETGRYVEVNLAACRMTGYSMEEFLTMSIPDILAQESLKDGLAQFEKVVKTGSSKANLTFRHKNGTKRWWSLETVQLSETRFLGFAKDITQRIKLEESLRIHQTELIMHNEELVAARSTAQDAAEKYTELYDFAPSGFFSLSVEDVIRELNHSGARMLGMERAKLIGKHFGLYVSHNTRPVFNTFLVNVFKYKTQEICEVMLETDGNQPKYLHLEGIVAGNRKHCLINAVDITERKLAEEMLNESRERYMAVTKSANDAIISANSSGSIINWNKGAERIFGYTEEEICGKNLGKIMPYQYAKQHDTSIERIIHGGEPHIIGKTVELLGLHKNGAEFPIEISLALWETGSGKFFTGIIRDITIRKKIEEDIRRANSFLDSVVENIPNMLFIKDANSLRFVRFNRAGEDLLGISREKLIGKNDYNFFSKKQADNFTAKDREVLLSRKMFDVPVESIKTIDKGIRILHTKKVPIMNNLGEPEFLLGISEDITERKETEAELQLRGEIIENMSEGVILFRADNGVIVYANPKCEHMFRYNPGELIGQHVSILNAPTKKSPEEKAAEIICQLKKGKVWQGEVRNIMKDGTRFWNQATISAFKHPQHGNVWISIQHDITERKRAEEELRKSEERFRHVSSTISDISYSCLSDEDDNFSIDWLTGAAERITGYSLNEIKAKKCWGALVVEEDRDLFNKHITSLAPGSSSTCELRLRHKSGKIVWVATYAECVRDEYPPGYLYLYGGLVSITERKITELILKESEEKYKTILNASPDGILVTNLKGLITDVSEIGIELLGANSRDELVGKNFLRFVPRDEKNTIREIGEKTMNEGLAQNIGLKIRKINKSVFAGETSATLIQGPDGTPVSYMIILRDISHRKKIETLQIHADRMASLGEMASGIAHEINQPLNIISMVVDKILFDSAKVDRIDLEFLTNKSDKIFENITRIRNIIDHIRAFSRNHDDYVLTAFSLNSSIENAVSMITEQFKHLGITLKLQLEKKIPQIVGNTFKFEQVILNLLVNAKDAVIERKTKEDGYSEMAVGIASYLENQFIMVEVTDNGIGISKDDINNILLPFYTTKDEGKGTGLGLSICYQIIKEMNGSIEITSDKIFGTKIKLVLELQKKK